MPPLRSRRHGLRTLALSACLASACSVSPDAARVVRGPLAHRVPHPLSLTLLAPRPRRAATQAAGSTGAQLIVQHATLFEFNDLVPGRFVSFDGELTRGAVRVRHGLDEHTDIELELAVLYASAGFLDGSIDAFHDAFLLPDAGRSTLPNDRFLMRAARDGEVLYDLEEHELGLADLPLFLTRRLIEEGAPGDWRPAVSLRAGVELPTGSEQRGFGNGGIDGSLGLLLERSLRRATLFGGIDWIETHTPDGFADQGLELRDGLGAQLGLELRTGERTSLLAELIWTQPLVPGFGVAELESDILDLGVGFARDFARAGRFGASFHEDLLALAGHDFSVRVVVSWGL